MRRAVWQIVVGFALACITAAFISMLIDRENGAVALSGLVPRILRTAAQLAVWALPGAILAIGLSEWLGLRSALFHLFAGAAVALLSIILKYGGIPVEQLGEAGAGWKMPLLTMGVLGGFAYWGIRGRQAGLGLAHLADGSSGAEERRCWPCVLGALAAASLPLFVASCWGLNEGNVIKHIIADAEESGNSALSNAGFGWASLKIDDAVGRIAGEAPNEVQKAAAFATARDVLKPMIGLPGVVSVLENAITVTTKSALPDQTELLLQAIEDARIAAEAEVKRKAEEARRLAAAAEAKRRAEQEAEEIRRADEERRMAVAIEDARRAAEDEARKRDEAQRLAALEAAKLAEPATPPPPSPPAVVEVAIPVPPPPPTPVAPEPAEAKKESCRVAFVTMLAKEKIEFNPGSAQLSEASAGLLDRLAEAGKSCASVKFRIDGHTDQIGSPTTNLRLSQRRADAVKAALISRGVAAADLSAQGFGEDKPIDLRDTKDAWARNRRIEFTVLDEPISGAASSN